MTYYDFLLACLIGIVEGITEFLPISSTGHMILVGFLVDFEGPKAASFEVFIQLGAILAVVVLYWDRFRNLFKFTSRESAQERNITTGGISGLRGILILGIGCLPALFLGALLHSYIKTNLFTPQTVCLALIVGGIIMIFVERIKFKNQISNLDTITYKQALAIGLFQSFALWPGVSRSASTIIGGMIAGLDRKAAAEFSFLLAVPIMCAATGWDLLKSLPVLEITDLSFFLVGFIVAFISAMLAIKLFISFLQKHTLTGFGVYRILLGGIYLKYIL